MLYHCKNESPRIKKKQTNNIIDYLLVLPVFFSAFPMSTLSALSKSSAAVSRSLTVSTSGSSSWLNLQRMSVTYRPLRKLRQTDQPTDRQTEQVIGKLHFHQCPGLHEVEYKIKI